MFLPLEFPPDCPGWRPAAQSKGHEEPGSSAIPQARFGSAFSANSTHLTHTHSRAHKPCHGTKPTSQFLDPLHGSSTAKAQAAWNCAPAQVHHWSHPGVNLSSSHAYMQILQHFIRIPSSKKKRSHPSFGLLFLKECGRHCELWCWHLIQAGVGVPAACLWPGKKKRAQVLRLLHTHVGDPAPECEPFEE